MTGSAAEYFSKFREIIAILEWTDPEPIVYAARDGLTSELKDCLAKNGQEFNDLESLSHYVVSLDNRLQVRETERKAEAARYSQSVSNKTSSIVPSFPTPSSSRVSSSGGQNSVQGPRVATNTPAPFKPGGLPLEEREKRIREGRCIRCGSGDHRKDACPKQAFVPNYPSSRPLPTPPASSFVPTSPKGSPKV